MKGKIRLRKDVKHPYWFVSWYHTPDQKEYRVSRYIDGKVNYQTCLDKDRCEGYRRASKVLAMMQSDEERGVLRIERYTGDMYTDTIPYLREWLEIKSDNLTPGGLKKYKTAVEYHMVPFFTKNQVMLHEIQFGTIMKLKNHIHGSGKNKKNVIDVLYLCLKYAHKDGKIPAMPPFPEKSDYDIPDCNPVWLTSNRQEAITNAIPNEHQPIFWFLKYHLRRPGEAMALQKEDYDPRSELFIIRRGVSDEKVINRTKTGDVHQIPCVDLFIPYLRMAQEQQVKDGIVSPFIFTCKNSRMPGKRYSGKILNRIWKEACAAVGEDIDLYSGLKHSSCGQLMHEQGLSETELKDAGDWKSLDTIKHYTRANVARRKNLLQGNVVSLEERRAKSS